MSGPVLQNDSANDNVKPQAVLESLQDTLIRRFKKVPQPPEPIAYEFTTDRALLHQYFQLRERMLGTDRFLPKGVIPEDIHDKISEILIARRGKLCIGGCRLTVREGDEMFPLPMETDDFKLRELFPHLPLNKEKHCVVSKFAILEDYKDYNVLYALCKIMYERIVSHKIPYLFMRATNIALARNWRLISNSILPKSTEICRNIEVPESPMYPGEKQYLIFTDLTSSYRNNAESETQPNQVIVKPSLTMAD